MNMVGSRAETGCRMDTFSFCGVDGLRRSVVVHDQGARALVIGSHGLFSWKGDESGKLYMLAEQLGRHDISLCRYDATGCGESEGNFIDSTLTQRAKDLDEVVQELFLRYSELMARPLFLLGSSFGGPVNIVYLNRSSVRVRGLITWSSPLDMVSVYRKRNPELFSAWQRGMTVRIEQEGRMFAMGPEFLKSLELEDVLQVLGRLPAVPMLVIHGGNDETVPLDEAYKLAERSSGEVALHIIEGASHRLIEHFPEVAGLTIDWILNNLGQE